MKTLPLRFGPTLFVLVLAACGGSTSAPPDASGFDAAPPDADTPFPVVYDTASIVLDQERTRTVAGVNYSERHYVNNSYRCGRTGTFTFLVVERADRAGQPAPLWAILHGGGVGYYDAEQIYHGPVQANDENTMDQLEGVLAGHLLDGARIKNTLVARRLAAGYRFLMPSMCDHDLYAGMGNPYPNNPNWNGQDTVDGLLATMAAIDFTVNGNQTSAGYATTLVFLHGTSAGSAGAYHVSHAFARNGIRLNGALLDSYVLSRRTYDLFGAGCTPQQRNDPGFDPNQVALKIGPFVADVDLHAEETVASAWDRLPLFDLIAQGDAHCCGEFNAVPAAVSAGFTNNCAYVHDPLFAAMDAAPSGLHGHLLVDIVDHVLSPDEGAHQQILQAWLDAILQTNPTPPWSN